MQKTVSASLPLKPSLTLVATALILVLGLMGFQWFTSQQMPDQESLNTTAGYGPLGYGRGQGTGQGSMNGTHSNQGLNRENCLMDGCLAVDNADFPVAKLDELTIEKLNMALADERKALATYRSAISKFGNVKPFVNIARAEENHISMLLALFDKYGVAIPKDATQVGSLPATLAEVCQVGVTAEIENDALYQTMIPALQQEDIKTVFTSLARASKEMHLPAFERCAQ